MVSKLVKIATAAAIIILGGNFVYNKVEDNRKYDRVYRKFVEEVSCLHSPSSEDNPTISEWMTVCSEIGYDYDRTGKETPRPTLEKMENWLARRGK